MFFLSGLFVWPSLKRKGKLAVSVGTVSLRIGVPLILAVLFLMPIAYYPAYRVTAVDPELGGLLASTGWRCRCGRAGRNGSCGSSWRSDVAAAGLYRFAPQWGDIARLGGVRGAQPSGPLLCRLW